MQDTFAIMIGTVVVLVILVLIALIVRQYKEGSIGGIVKILPAFFVVIVAVIVLGQIADIGQDDEPPYEVSYSFDASTGTLTVSSHVPDGYEGPWDAYAGDVRSLVIEDGVGTVGTGAFTSLTSLELLSIPDTLESIEASSFGVAFKDPFGGDMATLTPGCYVGRGDGTLYECDPSLFTYSADGTEVSGLTSAGHSATILVIPATSPNGTMLTAIGEGPENQSTLGGGAVTDVMFVPGSISNIKARAFYGCTTLTSVDLPDTVTAIGTYAFRDCRNLASIELPSNLNSVGTDVLHVTALTTVKIPDSLTYVGIGMFSGCTQLVSVELPSTLTAIRASAFSGCTHLASIDIPASVTQIDNLAFTNCYGITKVTFARSFSTATVNANAFPVWTFYDTDGTTVIDKTVAANLAGSTFQGTATALVKVLEGSRSLTPDQIQKVRLHDAELQDLKDRIALDPLPLRPSLEEELTA